MNFRRQTLWVSALIVLSLGAACSTDSAPSVPEGSCILPTNRGEGPTYCRDDTSDGYLCMDFRSDVSCRSRGFDYCCWSSSGDVRFQFQSAEDVDDWESIYGEQCGVRQGACGSSSGTDAGPGTTDECRWDSDCRSREVCRSGICRRVECTSDSHCGNCERCSDNVCRDCGSGPFGCYC